MSLRRNLSKYLALYSYVEAYRSNKLPEGYTKLSYIQGDGTAYIDLGISLTQNDSIEIDFIAKYTASTQIFGYRDGASSNNIILFTGGGSNSIFLDFNNSNYADYRLSATSTDGSEYKAILNKNVRQLLDSNGEVIVENTTVCSDTITTGNIYLFFAGGTPSGSSKFTGSIKEIIISGRMDLIPCKDPNNNIGMYDIISGKFFGNVADSGAFVAGDEIADSYLGFNTVKLKDAIHGKLNELTVYGKTKNKAVDGLDSLIANGGTEFIPETYLDTVIAKGKCVQENRLTNGLPSEYQELYYIESTGTQYINTGIKVKENTLITSKFMFTNSTAASRRLFGKIAGPSTAAMNYRETGTFYWFGSINVTASSNSVHIVDFNADGKIYLDGTQIGTKNTAASLNDTTMYLFAEISDNNTINYGQVKIYNFTIKEGGTIVQNLIPVRRKADGELGMYDTVSKTFLTNAGTGTFTASEDKLIDSTSSDYTILDYVTFDGTQVIDTGVICNEESRIESKWIANSSSMWVYGTGTTNPRITCYCITSGNERFGNVTVDSTGITHDVLNTLTQDKNGFYYNGTSGKPYSDVGTFTCLDTLTIGNSNGSSGTPLFAGNFYYMRIYDNGVLIRSYIPVKRNSDNVVGFFDTVSGTFITPFEGNALVAGTVKTTWEPTPNFPVDIWCNNGKIDKYGDVIALPSDYIQLEYLESTGTQYIETPITSVQNGTFYVDFQMVEIPDSGFPTIWGAMPGSSDYKVVFGSGSGKIYSQPGNGSGYVNTISKDTNRHQATAIIATSTETVIIDNQTFNSNFPITSDNTYPLSFFARIRYDGINNYAKVKIYRAWHKNANGETDFDVVPAMAFDGTLGMYDTISGNFLTNSGSGTFVAGPTIDNRNVQEVITAPNGKNLFDKNNIQRIYGYFSATNAQWAWATNGNSVKIPCKPNTKYTARYDGTSTIVVLGFGSTYTDDQPSTNNVFVPVTNSVRTPNPTKDTPVTITTGANDKWLIVAWPADELYPDQYEEMRQHIIVEEGETPTEYEAGKGFNTAKCEKLLSVGTYRDTQSILDGTITRNIGIKVLDGTEDWTASAAASNLFYSSSAITNADISNSYKPVSTHFNGVLGSTGYAAMQIGDFKHGSGSSTFYFRIPNITTAAECTQWFKAQYAAGTPVIIVYPLATPVTETISSAILNKKEVSAISGSLSISDLEVTSTESEHTIPTPLRPLSLRCNNGTIVTKFHNDDYTRLEYIESTDRLPAINTGARYSAGNDFIVEWSAIDTESQANSTTLFAATATTPYSGGLYGKNTSRGYYIGSTGTGQSGYASNDDLVHNWKIVVKDTKMDLYKDGTRVGGIDSISGTVDTEHDIYLFCGGWASASDQTLTQFTKWRLYSWKLTVAGTVVKDLVPAKRSSDNEIGMYDKVSDTFFINCATGSFVGGNITTDVEGTQETVITVKETNLFDKDTCEYINAYVNANTGVLTQGSPGSSTQYCFVIPCKSNTTYKLDGMTALSGWGSFTDSTIGTVASVFTKGNGILTTGPNDQYLIGMVYATGTSYDYRDTLDIREVDIMAYVENLLATDSTYVDTQNILTGTITRNVKAIVLDGTEAWSTSQTYSNVYTAGVAVDKPLGGIVPICNYYAGYSSYNAMTANDYGILAASTATLAIKNKDCADITAFTTWLADQYAAGTPVIVLYPLATSTTESVDAQEMRNSPASIKDASMEGLTLTQTHSIHTIPTPAFPLDLVCNNGVIKGVSKNLFDPAESNIVCGYWIKNNNGQLEASPTNFYTDNYMPVKPDTSYVAFGRKKSDGTLSNYNRIAWYDSSKTWIRNSTYTQGTVTVDTSPSNAAYARFHCNIDGSTLTTDYVLEWNWMLCEGTEEESFVPYGVMTEGNPEVLNIKGKNLYDITKDVNDKYIDANGNIGDDTSLRACYSDLIPVKSGETYTYSGICKSSSGTSNAKRLHGYINGVWNQQIQALNIDINKPFSYTFTIPAGINGIRISHWKDDTYTQVEEGPRPTRYEEYKNGNYSMPTLLSVGNFVDTQELQSGIYNGKIGVKVFDGTENWQNISGYMNISKTDLGSNSTVMPSNSHNIICSHFETKDGTFTDGIGIGENYVNVKYDSLFTTLAEWQQYLADQYAKGTPVTIVYPLANAITETEESKHIQIDAGTNEISRIGGINELEMEVKYKKLK